MIDKEKKRFENPHTCTLENCSYREDLKNEFTSLISYYNQVLRDPICLAYGTLQLMESRMPEVTNSEYWSSLKNDMEDLIQRLDDCESFSLGKKIDPCETNLFSMLKEAVSSIHETKEGYHISYQLHCDKISEQNINSYICDSVKLKIAFMNIIYFLASIMENTKNITICLNADQKLLCTNIDGNIYFNLTFSGDGCPLSDHILSSLYKPISSYHYGIAAANQIVKAHGGYFHTSLNENETLFTVELPLFE